MICNLIAHFWRYFSVAKATLDLQMSVLLSTCLSVSQSGSKTQKSKSPFHHGNIKKKHGSLKNLTFFVREGFEDKVKGCDEGGSNGGRAVGM